MKKSEALLKESEVLMPGGVNSPVRAYRAVGGGPPFIAKASGSKLFDADGKEYIDFVGSWGPAILGHAHPDVVARVQSAARHGLSFGAPTALELQFAKLINQRYPSIEMMRLVSSGTEATMSALRVARGYTKRDLIVKFDGAYHGHGDGLLVQAGSGAATFGHPDSAGVPKNVVSTTATVGFNDPEALEKLFAERGKEIAAVIVEPVVGNMGCVPPKPGFLENLAEICRRAGSLLVFDEVMTGCRVALGGAQERYGLKPDLTCLGKVVGGGLPLALYGGRREIMQQVAPLGPIYQAGTLSGNPLATSAGIATLELLTPAVYERLEARSAELQEGLERALAKKNRVGTVQRVASMLTLFFHEGPVNNWLDSKATDKEAFAQFHAKLLARGVYWPPSGFEAAFVSAAHTASDIEKTVEAVEGALSN